MANNPKRHHYVTRAYMRRFSDDNKHVYVLFKNAGGNYRIPEKPTSVEKLCVEKDFYTVFEEDGEKNMNVECVLAKIEEEVSNAVFSQIPPDLIFPFQEDGIILDARQKLMMIDTIATQITRGKTIREYGLSVINDYYLEILEETRKRHEGLSDLASQIKYLRDNEERIKNNVLVEGPVIEFSKLGWRSEFRTNLRNRQCFIMINATNLDFVTSDEPVLVCDGTKSKNGILNCPLENQNSIVYYPLDSKHMVALYTKEFCHASFNVTGNVMVLGESDRNFVRNINIAQYLQCNKCLIARDRESLKRVVGAKK